MALRLSRAFSTTQGKWINMQRGYDSWMAENQNKKDVAL
jgi:plasmid maintenance system antidote protein VapI